ncbi:MAG: S8/S53 family peptidase [Saccharothrix sp.]|nr:S8/S53 family peptidase [Saccharothrix sp.]
MSEPSSRSERYQKAFREALRELGNFLVHEEELGREFIYVADELLVLNEDASRVGERLRDRDVGNRPDAVFAGVTKLRLTTDQPIPELVRTLRDPRQWPGQRVPVVQPHHVLVGHGGNMHGNPGEPPHVGTPLADPDPSTFEHGRGVVVGVVDTGIGRSSATDHPVWLGDAYTFDASDEDTAYRHDDVFDLEGGHGTFVAGVVRQAAPGVGLEPEKALRASGVCTEEEFVKSLTSFEERVHIVNISLGCFTLDDVAPEPIRQAIRDLPDEVVVVASAGNQGTARPSWPAALYGVVAVAAIAEERDHTRSPACYSNHGHWVDACTVGNRTSTFLKGRWELPDLPADVFDRWAYWLGTSFAAPHVAGRIARTMTEQGLSAVDARDALLGGQPEFFPGYGVFVE